jgi:hypothetical protein
MSALRIFQKLSLICLLLFLGGCATQEKFAAPNLAVDSLVGALRTNDDAQLQKVLGSKADDLLFSGDRVQDQNDAERFLAAYDKNHHLIQAPDSTARLVVGADDWPFPIPIVQDQRTKDWRFDTAAGMEEIINRRIGRNELDTIETCRAIVDAQREYAQRDPQNLGIPVYARKFFSAPGAKDGLYWAATENAPLSPLGPLAAEASEEGYSMPTKDVNKGRHPYHGYFFRILTKQGPNADGGKRDYIVNGKMIGGFAVVAWPADYRNSGVMTFIVNTDGIVYQCDLGKNTAREASKMTEFNPDDDWLEVNEAGMPITQK